MDQSVMGGRFVVIAKAAARMADADNTATEAAPAVRLHRAGLSRRRFALAIGGLERVLREQVQDVGEQQFLVLLFMIDAKLDEFADPRRVGATGRGQQPVEAAST